MNGCPPVRFLRSSSARRTLTTIIIALGSSIVLALAGCANPAGIEPAAKLAAPSSPHAVAGPGVATVAPDCGEASASRCAPT